MKSANSKTQPIRRMSLKGFPIKWINFKIMAERTKAYVAWIQFIMVAILFIQQTMFNLITTLSLVAIALGILSLADFKWILPAELNRMAEKNPILMEIRRDIKELKANAQHT